MDGTEISKEEATSFIKQISGKKAKATVFYGGALNLEIGEMGEKAITTQGGKTFMSPVGEYSMCIDGNWMVSNQKEQIVRDGSTGSDDSEKIKKFIGDVCLSKIDFIDNFKVVSITLSDNKEINITGTDKNCDYFYISSRNNDEGYLVLTSDFKFKKIPRN